MDPPAKRQKLDVPKWMQQVTTMGKHLGVDDNGLPTKQWPTTKENVFSEWGVDWIDHGRQLMATMLFIAEWVDYNPKSKKYDSSAYRLKHQVEKWREANENERNPFVCNGTAIVADRLILENPGEVRKNLHPPCLYLQN